ncbi:hypothetical protein FCOIX_13906 [Fusarium coicis]|nr:hypothetical protein FCOIX_13906 [Fusarium coicis]
MAQLSASCDQPIKVTVNDHDLDIVARNTIMLLVALTADSHDEAIDCMMHLWYSAFIRKYDLDILQQRIRPLIEKVCFKIQGKPTDSALVKARTFGPRSLRLVLEKSVRDVLLSFMKVPGWLTTKKADEIRIAVTFAESRVDYRDRQFLFLSSSHHVARRRFRQDGLLLPFRGPRREFQLIALLQDADTWPRLRLCKNASLACWCITETLQKDLETFRTALLPVGQTILEVR